MRENSDKLYHLRRFGYDGDRKTDMAVYRHNIGVWYIIPSSTDTFYGVGWIGVLSLQGIFLFFDPLGVFLSIIRNFFRMVLI